MSLLWIIFAVLLLVVWIGTAIDIRRRRLGGWAAAGWLVVALVIPFVGAIVYWALRKPDAAERERTYDAEQSLRAERRDRGIDSTRPG
jgi:uncharacterized membrane protein YhaH (DUF805 family)